MNLNQARVASAGAGLLAVYALDKALNRSRPPVERFDATSVKDFSAPDGLRFRQFETVLKKIHVFADSHADYDNESVIN